MTEKCETDPFAHQWSKEYYGYKCKLCGQFIAYGCEPWMDYDQDDCRHGTGKQPKEADNDT